MGGEEQLLTNYLPDPAASYSKIDVSPGALPVITVSTVEKQISGRWLSIDIHANPAPSADTTIFLDLDDPAGLLDTDDSLSF